MTEAQPDPLPAPWALVTGGSSGIGEALAAGLLARGCHLVLVARDSVRLEAARARLEGARPGAPRTEALALDVGDAPAVAAAMAGLLARLGPPAWVVTSAGIALPGRFLDQPLAEHEAQLRTNALGTVNVLHALAPAMAQAGRGQVVLIASAAALGGFAGYAAYAPSKWAVRGLGEVLDLELGAHGVRVLTAFPPDTDTPQLAEERARRPAFTARFAGGARPLSPGFVAERILAAAERGARRVAPGFGASLLLWAGRPWARYLEAAQRRLLRRHPEDSR
ncbi:SDR family NAD(P)-dependent oxidoreductase [Sediminicoccus sp. BL-A-41-H5]|uniref:SDR family NAD(P)-dependent oxidoreductase n=1 Tax=Sediminicoccus sp. BL-A-41-H5 TaxID=3421106 RepID=UPI003D67FBFF